MKMVNMMIEKRKITKKEVIQNEFFFSVPISVIVILFINIMMVDFILNQSNIEESSIKLIVSFIPLSLALLFLVGSIFVKRWDEKTETIYERIVRKTGSSICLYFLTASYMISAFIFQILYSSQKIAISEYVEGTLLLFVLAVALLFFFFLFTILISNKQLKDLNCKALGIVNY